MVGRIFNIVLLYCSCLFMTCIKILYYVYGFCSVVMKLSIAHSAATLVDYSLTVNIMFINGENCCTVSTL